MNQSIPTVAARRMLDRQALLWVCQRYDLELGSEPHDMDTPAEDARLRYRSVPNEVDMALGSLYWEAVWLEGARSPVLASMRTIVDGQTPDGRRSLVTLASQADAGAQVSSQVFLPIYVLPGLIDDNVPQDAAYGKLRARARERVAFDLATHLEDYPSRTLVVFGAAAPDDLKMLYEVLEDRRIVDLVVVVVWPANVDLPRPPASPWVHFEVWVGPPAEFVNAITSIGAPSASNLPKWAIRVRNRSVVLASRETDRLLRRFAVITEQEFLRPARFGMDDLVEFLQGSLENWKAYSIGLPVRRSYSSETGNSFDDEIQAAITQVESSDDTRTFVVQLPCEPGAGSTTLLRATAFNVARRGYPAIVLKPHQVDIQTDDIAAFATALVEASLTAGIPDSPPLIIVLDVEHFSIPSVRHLAPTLAAHGRRAVVVQAVPLTETTKAPARAARSARLRPLDSVVVPAEIQACQLQFERAAQEWGLELTVPSLSEWEQYESSNKQIRSPDGQTEATSLFWVALRFFLTEGMDITASLQAHHALSDWIKKRTGKIRDPRMWELVNWVAALTSFRLVCPLWTVLRPATAGNFGSELVWLFEELDGIIGWSVYSEDLEDHVLHFSHPALADEHLASQGIQSAEDKCRQLEPMFAGMSTGSRGDVWTAEMIAATVLAPPFGDRAATDWQWRIETFGEFPASLSESSKTILHHWARCLYFSAAGPNLPNTERKTRLEEAIQKLSRATELPRRQSRDEHPSHIYNTLGTAYSRYTEFLLDGNGTPQEAAYAWDEACSAFTKAIALSGGINVEALLAFAARLLTHAGVDSAAAPPPTHERVHEVVQALSLLDDAEDIMGEYQSSDWSTQDQAKRYKTQALEWLKNGAGYAYAKQLQSSSDPELGYCCEARLALYNSAGEVGVQQALQVMQGADNGQVLLRLPSLTLYLWLLKLNPQTQFDFQRQLQLQRRIESDPEYAVRSVDLFKHGVLCYQVGLNSEGKECFRRLREQMRSSGNPPTSLRDFWRDQHNPAVPRITHIRVKRRVTEWRADGFVDDLQQSVPLRPRHFDSPPQENEVVECIIRFESNGPLAVPPRFGQRRER